VGKSSLINTILGVSKASHGVVRVGVSSTPGKTKHFQTLVISDTTVLCDCPGLVFPSFMRSTGEMLCAGILPVNQMRDYIEPATVIASRVQRHLLDATYGMTIERVLDFKDDPDRPPTPHEMLEAYCKLKVSNVVLYYRSAIVALTPIYSMVPGSSSRLSLGSRSTLYLF
jgi:large subunit GTPase 1